MMVDVVVVQQRMMMTEVQARTRIIDYHLVALFVEEVQVQVMMQTLRFLSDVVKQKKKKKK